MGLYRLLEHTADIGVELEADSLAELLRQAILSFHDLVDFEPDGPLAGREHQISADTVEELLVNCYNELVFLLEQRLVAVDARILACSETELAVELLCSTLGPEQGLREIKAATWHQLEVTHTTEGWRARVYLDL
ncbi:MAG: archease [Deltaproteobacteria bacterium]|nr:MAG: archease [Deltaproteobacteria bacterium]